MMRRIPKHETVVLTEPTRSELFELFTRSAALLAAVGEARDDGFANKLDLLISQGWDARLEMSFDGAGPLLGALTVDSPQGVSVEAVRMDATSYKQSRTNLDSGESNAIFKGVSLIAQALLLLTASQTKTDVASVDDLLAEGATCTLRFLIAGNGPLSCILLLDSNRKTSTELVRVNAPAQQTLFRFSTAIASAKFLIESNFNKSPILNGATKLK